MLTLIFRTSSPQMVYSSNVESPCTLSFLIDYLQFVGGGTRYRGSHEINNDTLVFSGYAFPDLAFAGTKAYLHTTVLYLLSDTVSYSI